MKFMGGGAVATLATSLVRARNPANIHALLLPTARFQRLKKWFENPIYLLFFQSILPTLNCTNKFLQRDEPLIHLLQPHLLSLVQKVLSKFVKPTFLVAGKSGYQF